MKKLSLLILIISTLVVAQPTRAFDETHTHPYLTKLILEEYNKTATVKLSADEMSQIIIASQAEDTPNARSLNHFYNPQTNEGLSLDGLIVGYGATDWAYNNAEQNEPLFGGNYTWPNGLKAYQTNDTTTAYTILGHSLHLLEDMGVPAHTRNDEHLAGDSLEAWLKIANSANAKLSLDYNKINRATCSSLKLCLENLATFSNTNFFSDNTLTNETFSQPWQSMALGKDHYAYVKGNPVAFDDPITGRLILNDTVLRDYWRRLAPMIISYGEQVVNLFFTTTPEVAEAELKANQTRGQISAGGLKITAKAPQALRFNRFLAPLAPVVKEISHPEKLLTSPEQRFFPIIDFSQMLPPAFLTQGESVPIFIPQTAPQVAGLKIETPTDPEPIIEPENATTTPSGNNSQATTTPSGQTDTTTTPSGGDPIPEIPATPDIIPPTATWLNSPTTAIGSSFVLTWQGADDVSASSSLQFDLDYKILPTGDWQTWLATSSLTSAIFENNLPEETPLTFRLRAIDEAGNVGAWQTANVLVFQTDNHNPLLYENLQHLYHFAECQDVVIADSVGSTNLTQRASWLATGRWGCATHQSYPGSEALGAHFASAVNAPEATLSFYWQDVSSYPLTTSRNRFIFFRYDAGNSKDWTFGLIPEIGTTRAYVNGAQIKLSGMPADHNWHLVSLVASAQYLAFYLDGQLIDQQFGDFSLTSSLVGLSIVGENSPSNFDELALWNRALSSDELMLYYNVGQPLKQLKINN